MSLQDKIILITGGAGFIGSNLVRSLNSVGIDNIIIIDNFHNCTNDKWKNLIGLKYLHLEDLNTDGTDSSLFKTRKLNKNLVPTADIIVHLGALNNTVERDFGKFFNLNIQFTRNILQAALTNKQCKKFIYASSASTYGNMDKFDDTQPIESLKPTNAYGMSKQSIDELIFSTMLTKLDLDYSKKMDIVGLKFSNVFGIGEQHKIGYSSFPYKVLTMMSNPLQYSKDGRVKVNIFSEPDKLMSRDFVYINDVVDRIFYLMDFDIKRNTIYNVGSGFSIEWDDLFYKIYKAFFNKVKYPEHYNISVVPNFIPIPHNIKAGYQYHTEMNMNKFDTDYPKFEYLDQKTFKNADEYYDSRIKLFVEKFIG